MGNKDLLFAKMALRARLQIRDFFLNNMIREVYENIGQVLSLVKMQLAIPGTEGDAGTEARTNSTQDLLGQAIRDLRVMSKAFYPDIDILKGNEFTEIFARIVTILYPHIKHTIKIEGLNEAMESGLKLIVFDMMREILIHIKGKGGVFINLTISCSKNSVNFIVKYRGTEIPLDEAVADDGLEGEMTLLQRAQLINGRFHVINGRDHSNHLKLILPIKEHSI